MCAVFAEAFGKKNSGYVCTIHPAAGRQSAAVCRSCWRNSAGLEPLPSRESSREYSKVATAFSLWVRSRAKTGACSSSGDCTSATAPAAAAVGPVP